MSRERHPYTRLDWESLYEKEKEENVKLEEKLQMTIDKNKQPQKEPVEKKPLLTPKRIAWILGITIYLLIEGLVILCCIEWECNAIETACSIISTFIVTLTIITIIYISNKTDGNWNWIG